MNSEGDRIMINDRVNLNPVSIFGAGPINEETASSANAEYNHPGKNRSCETAVLSETSLVPSSMARHAFNDISVQLPGSNWEPLLQTHSQLLEEAAIFDVYSCLGKRECDPSSSGLEVEFTATTTTGAVLTLKHTSDALEVHLLVTQQDRLREYTYNNVMKMYNFFQEREQFASTWLFTSKKITAGNDQAMRCRVTSPFRLRFRGDWTSILLQRRCEWMMAFCKDVCRHLMLEHTDVRNIQLQQHESAEDERGEDTVFSGAATLHGEDGVNELEVTFALCTSEYLTDGDTEYTRKLSDCRYGRVWGLYFETYPSEIPYDLHYCFSGEYWEFILERYTSELEEAAVRDIEHHFHHHPEDTTTLGIGTLFLMTKQGAYLLCKFTNWNDHLRRSIGRRLERCRFEEVWKLYRDLSDLPKATRERVCAVQLHHFFYTCDNYLPDDDGQDDSLTEFLTAAELEHQSLSRPPIVFPLLRRISYTTLSPDLSGSDADGLHTSSVLPVGTVLLPATSLSPRSRLPSSVRLPLPPNIISPLVPELHTDGGNGYEKCEKTDDQGSAREEGKPSESEVILSALPDDESILVLQGNEKDDLVLPALPSSVPFPPYCSYFNSFCIEDKEMMAKAEEPDFSDEAPWRGDRRHSHDDATKNNRAHLDSRGDEGSYKKVSEIDNNKEKDKIIKNATELLLEVAEIEQVFSYHSQLSSPTDLQQPSKLNKKDSKSCLFIAGGSKKRSWDNNRKMSSHIHHSFSSHLPQSPICSQGSVNSQQSNHQGAEQVEPSRYSTSGSLFSSTSFNHGFSAHIEIAPAVLLPSTPPLVPIQTEHKLESINEGNNSGYSVCGVYNGEQLCSVGPTKDENNFIHHPLPSPGKVQLRLSHNEIHHINNDSNISHEIQRKVREQDAVREKKGIKYEEQKIEERRDCRGEKGGLADDSNHKQEEVLKNDTESEDKQKEPSQDNVAASESWKSKEGQQMGEVGERICKHPSTGVIERVEGSGDDELQQPTLPPLPSPWANTSSSLVDPITPLQPTPCESGEPSFLLLSSSSPCPTCGIGDVKTLVPQNTSVFSSRKISTLFVSHANKENEESMNGKVSIVSVSPPLPTSTSLSIVPVLRPPLKPLTTSSCCCCSSLPQSLFPVSNRASGKLSSFLNASHFSHSFTEEVLLPTSSCFPNCTPLPPPAPSTAPIPFSPGSPSPPPPRSVTVVPRRAKDNGKTDQLKLMNTLTFSTANPGISMKKQGVSTIDEDTRATTTSSWEHPSTQLFLASSVSSGLVQQGTTRGTTTTSSTRLPEVSSCARVTHSRGPLSEDALHQKALSVSSLTTISSISASLPAYPNVDKDQEMPPLVAQQPVLVPSALCQITTKRSRSSNNVGGGGGESGGYRGNKGLKDMIESETEVTAEVVSDAPIKTRKKFGEEKGGNANDINEKHEEQRQQQQINETSKGDPKKNYQKDFSSHHYVLAPSMELGENTALPHPLPVVSSSLSLPSSQSRSILPPIRR